MRTARFCAIGIAGVAEPVGPAIGAYGDSVPLLASLQRAVCEQLSGGDAAAPLSEYGTRVQVACEVRALEGRHRG